MLCPNCKAENPPTALTCSACGADLANPYEAPTTSVNPPLPERDPGLDTGGDETVATIIPYKNPSALIAYYLGLFSCCPVPVLGLAMGIVSIVLAVKGFKAARLNPKAHGKAHAWVGIICGSIGVMIGLLSVTVTVFAVIQSMNRR